MELYEEVILLEDIPHEIAREKLWFCDQVPKNGLKKGTKGAIVDIFITPFLAYDVEFFDDQGKELGIICLVPNQIKSSKI